MKIQFNPTNLYAMLALSGFASASDTVDRTTDTFEPDGVGDGGQTIVGGDVAPVGRYTHTVALATTSGFQFCGGSLIAPNVVLTAAHCMGDNTFDVFINRHDKYSNQGEVIRRETAIVHPNYNPNTLDNDYAVVILESATTQDVDFITLNSDEAYPSPGSTSRAMGWGTTSSGGSSSQYLREVDLPIISNQECDSRYSYDITSSMICTFQPSKDSCQGDSGGPLIIPGQSAAEDTLIGVVSWGIGCATSTYPGVYARVSKAYEWIKETACNSNQVPSQLCGSGGTPSTNAPVTLKPTNSPITSAPTSADVADFVKVGTGYCYDSSDNWYSAFKSVDLPSSTTDTYCIQWCLQNKRSNLVAVEIYRGNENMNCYCDFSGGSVPDDISTTDYNPFSQGALTYPGVGPVEKTDFVSSATCYRNNGFMQTPSPTNQAATPNPTKSSSTESPSTEPTNFPTKNPTSPPTKAPTKSPTKMPTKSPTTKPTAPPTNSPTTKPTALPTNTPSVFSPVSSAPTSTSGGPQDASFDASFGVPRCTSVGSACSSGSLLNSRANLGSGEPNQPNTLKIGGTTQCRDGTSGSYHYDESLDKIVVRSGEINGSGSDVNLVEGGRATIIATVFAWNTGASDTADFFYTSDASNPDWQYIGSVTPSSGGEQDLKIAYNLPQGTNQAVRVQFRYGGSISACAFGSYNDRDDLMFTVGKDANQPTQSPIKTSRPTEAVGGGPQQALYDPTLTVPRCSVYGSECDSLTLLKGRGTMSGGNEPNRPNTLSASCFDGNAGSYLSDESIERIVVRSGNVDGLGSGVDMMEGSKATIIATVHPWLSGFYDYADFYYASDSSNPVWQFITTKRPAGSGLQELKVDYTLPAGSHQAVRVNFRYRGKQGTNGACSGGSWDDIDDLAFGVKVNPSSSFTGAQYEPVEGTAEELKDVTVDAKKRTELSANQSKNRKGSKSSKNSKRKARE